MTLADVLEGLRGGADELGRLRYGVPTSEKERLALTQSLPGAPVPDADAAEAERYASGYLFAREHPVLSEVAQPVVDRIRTGWAGDSPELQSWATAGASAARTHEPRSARLNSLAAILASIATGR
jgi:hypothetical protein